MTKINNLSQEELEELYLEVKDIRERIQKILDVSGHSSFTALATKEIEHDIEREVGKRLLKKKDES